MGKGIVDQLKNEFDIHDEWLPYEIHPDTPSQGVLWEQYFQGMNAEQFFSKLDAQGKSMGVRFNHQPLMSNSNLAMQAGELAKEKGVYESYHEAVFKAFFTDCLDIGDRQVIIDIIASLGMKSDELLHALENETYAPVLIETRRRAATSMVTAAPTFFIEGGEKITGAQPLETFREVLQRVSG